MLNNLTQILEEDYFLNIKDNLTASEFIDQVVPKGFEDIVNIHTDGYSVFITATNEDLGYTPEIQISNSVFNPDFRTFPKFLLTDLTKNLCVLNQNQMLHLMITYRLNQMKPMKRPYLNLISSDISSIMRYIQYVEANSYNAKIKNKNLTVVINYEKLANLLSQFSETVINSGMTEDHWNAFYSKNPIDVCSVGSVSSSNAVTMKLDTKNSYRSVGFKAVEDGFYTIFPPAQNVPARLQTHLLGDAYRIDGSCQSIYQQDNLVKDGVLVPKDNSLKAGIIVFHPIEESGRFLSGEIEIDTEIASQLLEVTTNVEDCFKELHVKKGQTYHPKFEDFIVGINNLDDEVIISNAKRIEITDVFTTGLSGARRIRMKVIKKADNARITSNTGLKGVTKVMTSLGQIQFASPEEVLTETPVLEDIESNDIKALKRRYPNLDLDNLDNFDGISKEHKPLIIKPNLVCGMNSVKAKSNTIVAAQAALAVHLGFYTPTKKFGFDGLLDTLNMKEMNEAAQSLPEFTYLNSEGHEVKVEIGLVYLSYTEMCSTYTKVRPQSFPFIAGYHLVKENPNSKAIYQYIWDNYLEEDKIEASKELYKILLTDSTGIVNNSDDLPMYNIEDINNIFSTNDLVLSVESEFPSDSLLLDEEFNSKGFFIDLSKYQNAPVIRIPSAKTLNMFSGRLKNGNFIYHINLVNVSKILRGCLKTENGISLNTVYSKDKSRRVSSLAYYAYLNTVRSTIFSGEQSSHQIVQSFIKPKIKGCSFKQIAEHHLPDNTVVINDDRVYNSLLSESLKGSPQGINESQIKMMAYALKLETSTCPKEQKELFKLLNKESPRALAIRNPCLWSQQVSVATIWDRHMYEIYLKLYHNKSLNEVMDTYYNRDILLTSENLIVTSRGDCDGDLYPLTVLDYEGQKLLKQFSKTNNVEEELNWLASYKAKEFASTNALTVEHKYQLHKINTNTYSDFLNNAVIAKGNIGQSSIDIWSFGLLVECYQAYCLENNYSYQKKNHSIHLPKVTNQEAKLLVFIYTRLVQELVIEGVKHTSNGSKGFEIYFLNNIGDKKNEKQIRKDLVQGFGISSNIVDKLLLIIRFSSDNHNLIKGCKNFITLYNKGRYPADREALEHWETFIVEHTFFGNLIKPLYDIKSQFEQDYEESLDSLDELFDLDSIDLENLVI